MPPYDEELSDEQICDLPYAAGYAGHVDGVSCYSCGCEDLAIVGEGGEGLVMRCRGCGEVQQACGTEDVWDVNENISFEEV